MERRVQPTYNDFTQGGGKVKEYRYMAKLVAEWAAEQLRRSSVFVPGLKPGELRHARMRLGWTQEELAERMTVLRDLQLQEEPAPFTVQQVSRLEAGRVRVCLGDEKNEPLWWALAALGVSLRLAS